MSEASDGLLIMKGMMVDEPPERQLKVKNTMAAMRSLMESNGEEGILAFAIFGLEVQVEQEKAESAKRFL